MTPQQLLAPFPPAVRSLMSTLRSLVSDVIPTATERVYPGWRAIGYRDPQAGYFCGLFPQEDGVQVVFERGAELEDPDGLFGPANGLRQVRTIELSRPSKLRRAAFAAMLRRAVVHGSAR